MSVAFTRALSPCRVFCGMACTVVKLVLSPRSGVDSLADGAEHRRNTLLDNIRKFDMVSNSQHSFRFSIQCPQTLNRLSGFSIHARIYRTERRDQFVSPVFTSSSVMQTFKELGRTHSVIPYAGPSRILHTQAYRGYASSSLRGNLRRGFGIMLTETSRASID